MFLNRRLPPLEGLKLDGFNGIRYDFEHLPAQFKEDRNDLAPRIGLAYSPSSQRALKPNRCPRNQECESHYKPVRIDAGEHFRCIRHAGEIRRDINRVGRKQSHDENTQQPLWKSLTKMPCQALPCHRSDSGTHHLNRGHQRPRQECSPEKFGSKLRARHRIRGNARWVIVSSPGDNAWAKRLQQQSHPSSWGKYRHE
jgi:hypothetical protein